MTKEEIEALLARFEWAVNTLDNVCDIMDDYGEDEEETNEVREFVKSSRNLIKESKEKNK